MATITLLDDRTRPAAPSLGALSDRQRLPGEHLRVIHDMHRRNMETIRALIGRIEDGSLPASDAAASLAEIETVMNVRRFGAVCGQHCALVHAHHSIEDAALFPELSEKAVAFRAVVERLKAEHAVIHALLLRLLEAVDAIDTAPNDAAYQATRDAFTSLEAVLLSHFRYEEDSIGDAMGAFGIGV